MHLVMASMRSSTIADKARWIGRIVTASRPQCAVLRSRCCVARSMFGRAEPGFFALKTGYGRGGKSGSIKARGRRLARGGQLAPVCELETTGVDHELSQ